MLSQEHDWLLSSAVSDTEKYRASRDWLKRFEKANLDALRQEDFSLSEFGRRVTILTYVFYKDEHDFEQVEFAILHTWHVFGYIPVVIIVDRITTVLSAFQQRYSDYVRFAISPVLKAGNGDLMSVDCVLNLYHYFETPYCLIIQGDGFPLRKGLDEFLGQYDYIGAPAVRSTWRESIADILLKDCLNGGFCLRSRRFCEAVAKVGKEVAFSTDKSVFVLEDDFYCRVARRNLLRRLSYRLPWAWVARRFSVIDIYGTIDVTKLKTLPLGAHGSTTLFQYQDYLCDKFGYKPVPLYHSAQESNGFHQ